MEEGKEEEEVDTPGEISLETGANRGGWGFQEHLSCMTNLHNPLTSPN